jgi:hypothetical protein
MAKIIINGEEREVDADALTYDQIAVMAGVTPMSLP